MLRQLFHLIFIFLGLSTTAYAKSLFDLASPVFIPVETGNYEIYTYKMTQSSSGLMWFGDGRGIYTYDGYEYKYLDYLSEGGEPFPSIAVRDIEAAEEGVIWAATHKQGLIQINEKNRTFKKINPIENGKKLSIEESFRDIIVVDTSGLWLAGDNGVDYYDIQKNSITRYPIQEKYRSQVQVLSRTLNGKILVGTSAGLLVFDPARGSYSLPPYKSDFTFNGKRISEIIIDKFERVWIGTFNDGAFLYHPNGTIQQLGNYQRVVSIVQLNDEMWLGTKNHGIAIYDIEKAEFIRKHAGDEFTPLALGDRYIANLFVSRSGILWVSAWAGRIWMTPPSRDFARYLLYSPIEKKPSFKDDISSITEIENGDIWISSLSKGIDVYDPKIGYVSSITTEDDAELSLPSNKVTFVKRGKGGRSVWLGTSDKGVHHYTADNENNEEKWSSAICKELSTNNTDIKAFRMFQRSDGAVFFLTYSGLYKLKEDSNGECGLIKITSPESKMPRYLIETDAENLLVIEYGNIYLLAKDSTRLKRLNINYLGIGAGPKPQIDAGYRVGPGKYFLTTRKHLFEVVNLNESEITVEMVYVGDGRVWLQTGDEHGNYWGGALYWLAGKPQARPYQLADGYSPKAGYNLDFEWTRNGDLIIASQKGLFIQRTKAFTEWNYKPPLVLSNVRVDGEIYSGSLNALRMEPNEKAISLSFAALDYSGSVSIRYRYKLEGYSDGWTEVGADMRTATFANMFPGEYLFRLQSTNRVGDWSGLELAVPLNVMPAWYQSYAFYLACILVVLLLLYGLHLWRLGYYRRKKAELEGLVHERTEDLAQSMEDLKNTQAKLLLSEKQASLGRLVSGVAHEINTPLGIIKMAHSAAEQTAQELFDAFQMHEISDKPVHTRLKKFHSSNQLVDSNLHRLSGLVDSFKKISVNVEEWKFKVIDLENALSATAQTFHSQADSIGVTIHTDIEQGLSLKSSPIVIQSVVSELLKNALLHGFPNGLSGNITVRAYQSREDTGVVIIECEDTGVGISQELYPVLFDPFTAEKPSHLGLGLHVVFNFVSHVLSGEISCSNANDSGSGCCFTVLIPNQHEH